ncbi:MAG: hypothetical protein ACRDRX_04575 [Pseudonocardiaceae bacterium]
MTSSHLAGKQQALADCRRPGGEACGCRTNAGQLGRPRSDLDLGALGAYLALGISLTLLIVLGARNLWLWLWL